MLYSKNNPFNNHEYIYKCFKCRNYKLNIRNLKNREF